MKTDSHPIAVIITGGNSPHCDLLHMLPENRFVVAADSGYGHARALGLNVNVLIGDLDSISDEDRSHAIENSIPSHTAPQDKDFTDTEMAIEWAIENGFNSMVLISGGGGRLDHDLAVTHALGNPRLSGIELHAFIGSSKVQVAHGPNKIQFDTQIGATIGLIAPTGVANIASTSGLKWELRNENLHPWSGRGVSNIATESNVSITVDSGVLFVITELQSGKNQ